MVLWCYTIRGWLLWHIFLKKLTTKKVLIFRFIQAFTILNAGILPTRLINLLVMFMSFRQRALTILSPSTKKKLSDWTRKQMLQKPQKKRSRFQMIRRKNSLAISRWKTLTTSFLSKSILISCRPLLTSALMFLTWSLPLFTQDLSSHVQNQRLMTKWFQSFLNPTIFL